MLPNNQRVLREIERDWLAKHYSECWVVALPKWAYCPIGSAPASRLTSEITMRFGPPLFVPRRVLGEPPGGLHNVRAFTQSAARFIPAACTDQEPPLAVEFPKLESHCSERERHLRYVQQKPPGVLYCAYSFPNRRHYWCAPINFSLPRTQKGRRQGPRRRFITNA